MHSSPECRRSHLFPGCPFRRVWPFVHLSGDILFPRYLQNSSSNLDETVSEYSIALTDDLVRFWRSNVSVTAGRRDGKGIDVDASLSPI